MDAAQPRRSRRWLWATGLLLTLALGLALYTWASLNFAYARGDRVGYIQRFSKRGWICKTWEGELAIMSAPGAMPEKFYFSTSDPRVAAQVNGALGKRVRLTYAQHVGVPSSCFGESPFFVGDVEPIE
jgi:hypothetical protein